MNSLSTILNTSVSNPVFIMPDIGTPVYTEMTTKVIDDVDHRANPIKNMNDIIMIKDYFRSKGRYRDELLFVAGINFGLRIGDLLNIKIGDILDENFNYRNPFYVTESKTKKPRKVYINEAVNESFSNYIENHARYTGRISFDDYIFWGQGNNCMTRRNADYILRNAMKDLGMSYNCGTHMLRKTFAYWTLKTARDQNRALYYLQKALNHSSSSVTLFYAGITDDEIMNTYMSLNLGVKDTSDIESNVVYTTSASII